MNKHEALIRDIAEEMAKIEYANTYKSYVKYTTTHANSNVWSAGFYRQQWPILVERHVPFARIAVKHMADSFKLGAKWSVCKAWTGKELGGKMKEDGLIPDREAGNT